MMQRRIGSSSSIGDMLRQQYAVADHDNDEETDLEEVVLFSSSLPSLPSLPTCSNDAEEVHDALGSAYYSSKKNNTHELNPTRTKAAAWKKPYSKTNSFSYMQRFATYVFFLVVGVMTLEGSTVLRLRRYLQEELVKPQPSISSNHLVGIPQEYDNNNSYYPNHDSGNNTLRGQKEETKPVMMIRQTDDINTTFLLSNSLENTTIYGEAVALSDQQSLRDPTYNLEQEHIVSINATNQSTTVLIQKDDSLISDEHTKHSTGQLILSSNSTANSTLNESIVNTHDGLPPMITTSTKEIECWSFEKRCAMLMSLNQTTVHDNSRSSRQLNLQGQASKTLALNDPLLRDGYRNQFMRFVTFVIYALQHGFEQILLPSIRWNCDHRKNRYDSVVFHQLFDVDYWNTHHTNLPRLIPYNESEHYDWDPFTGLFRGACHVMDTYLTDDGDGKRIIFNRTGHFQHPESYGGGYGLGDLFYNYRGLDAYRQDLPIQNWNTTVPFLEIEAQIIRAMRPTATIERILQQTLDGGTKQPPYIALHARIEPEMLIHPMCLDRKVFNLTTILDMIRGMDHDADIIAANPSLYIAISMEEMQEENKFSKFQLEHQLNMAALQDALHHGFELPTTGQNLTVSAGSQVAIDQDVVDSCANEIVSSVISFEIAVRANIFIGTYISSWSSTVWKARHALGRGGNYAYTPTGLVNITDFPPPFQC